MWKVVIAVMLLAVCAGADTFDVSLYTMSVLNVGDTYFSLRAFSNGYSELNPFLRPMARNPYTFVAAKLTLSIVNYLGLKWMYKKNKTVAWCMSVAANIALGYVIYKNGRLR